MGALVDENTAALATPGCTPGSRVVVGLGTIPVGDDIDHPLEITQLAVLNQLTDLLEHGIGALIVHDCQKSLPLF